MKKTKAKTWRDRLDFRADRTAHSWGSGYANTESEVELHFGYVDFDEETGEEIGADQVLNSPAVGIANIWEPLNLISPQEGGAPDINIIYNEDYRSKAKGAYLPYQELLVIEKTYPANYNECDPDSIDYHDAYELDFNDVLLAMGEHTIAVSDRAAKVKVFISPKQSSINYNACVTELNAAVTKGQMWNICQYVLEAQARPNGGFFFGKGELKQFWNLYRAKKALMQEKENARIQTFNNTIAELEDRIAAGYAAGNTWMIKVVKQDIYKISYAVLDQPSRMELFALCDSTITNVMQRK